MSSMPLRAAQRAAISKAPRMAYSPVPTPEGTKDTYWETKAPSSGVLGIGKDVPSSSYAVASLVSAVVGGYCTGAVNFSNISEDDNTHPHTHMHTQKQKPEGNGKRVLLL